MAAFSKLEEFEVKMKEKLLQSPLNHVMRQELTLTARKHGFIVSPIPNGHTCIPMSEEGRRPWMKWGFFPNMGEYCAMTIGSPITPINVPMPFAMPIISGSYGMPMKRINSNGRS